MGGLIQFGRYGNIQPEKGYSEIDERIFNAVDGNQYSNLLNSLSVLGDIRKGKSFKDKGGFKDPYFPEIFKYSLGYGDVEDMSLFEQSPYNPSVSSNEKGKYLRLKNINKKKLLEDNIDFINDENATKKHARSWDLRSLDNIDSENDTFNDGDPWSTLGKYTLSKGEDKKGKYISMYDIWDLGYKKANSFLDRKPEIYDRIYYDNTDGNITHTKFQQGGQIMAKDGKKGQLGVKDGKLKQAYDTGTPLRNIYTLPSDASDYQKLLATQSTKDAMNRARWANFQGEMTDYPSGRTVPSFQYTPGVLEEMEKRGLTRDYIESWQPDNYPEEFAKGGILASIGKGAASGALGGAAVGGLGALPGALIGGLGGLFGGLLNRRNENRQEDLLAQQQQSLLAQQPLEDPTVNPLGMTQVANQYAPTFPMGGQVETRLAELETGEPFRSPDGSIGVVKEDDKLSHTNGGATLPLEVGTQILGKDKDPDTKKTFKEMGKKLAMDKKKYDKILEGNKGTYSTNAAKAMNAKIDNQFTNLFQKQESLKPQSQQGTFEQFAGGGLFGRRPPLQE